MKIAYLAYVDSPGSGVKKIDSQIVAWNFLGHDVRPFFLQRPGYGLITMSDQTWALAASPQP